MNRSLAFGALLGATLLLSESARAVRFTEYPIPTSATFASAIVSGPDGRLWFTELAKSQLGVVTTDGVFTEYPLSSTPYGIATVPGRLVAFAESAGIGFASADGKVTEFPGYSQPKAVVFGPDGRLWIADGTSTLIAFHFLASSPQTETIPISGPATSLALGRDGRIWASEFNAKKVAACPPQGGACVEWAVTAGPHQIAAAPDGSVWFTEPIGNLVGRITRTGALQEFPIPTAGGEPEGICAGPDGNMWFTEYDSGKVARITNDGAVTEYAPPTYGFPAVITTGPDGNLWFIERGTTTNKIAKLELFVPGDANADGKVEVADVFYLINYLFAGGPAPK